MSLYHTRDFVKKATELIQYNQLSQVLDLLDNGLKKSSNYYREPTLLTARLRDLESRDIIGLRVDDMEWNRLKNHILRLVEKIAEENPNTIDLYKNNTRKYLTSIAEKERRKTKANPKAKLVLPSIPTDTKSILAFIAVIIILFFGLVFLQSIQPDANQWVIRVKKTKSRERAISEFNRYTQQPLKIVDMQNEYWVVLVYEGWEEADLRREMTNSRSKKDAWPNWYVVNISDYCDNLSFTDSIDFYECDPR